MLKREYMLMFFRQSILSQGAVHVHEMWYEQLHNMDYTWLHNCRYNQILPYNSPSELSLLEEEFTHYQLLSDQSIPQSAWDEALVKCNEDDEISYHRNDILWHHLSMLKSTDGRPMFPRLSKIAKVVLIIPHSNADEERVFSLVRKNKTPFRPNLSLDKTLSSILSIKLATEEPCHKIVPHQEVVSKASKVTWEYNKQHTKK